MSRPKQWISTTSILAKIGLFIFLLSSLNKNSYKVRWTVIRTAFARRVECALIGGSSYFCSALGLETLDGFFQFLIFGVKISKYFSFLASAPPFPGPIPSVCGSPVTLGTRGKCKNVYIRLPTLKGHSDTFNNVSLNVFFKSKIIFFFDPKKFWNLHHWMGKNS